MNTHACAYLVGVNFLWSNDVDIFDLKKDTGLFLIITDSQNCLSKSEVGRWSVHFLGIHHFCKWRFKSWRLAFGKCRQRKQKRWNNQEIYYKDIELWLAKKLPQCTIFYLFFISHGKWTRGQLLYIPPGVITWHTLKNAFVATIHWRKILNCNIPEPGCKMVQPYDVWDMRCSSCIWVLTTLKTLGHRVLIRIRFYHWTTKYLIKRPNLYRTASVLILGYDKDSLQIPLTWKYLVTIFNELFTFKKFITVTYDL